MAVSGGLAQMGLLGLLSLLFVALAARAHDPGFAFHMWVFVAAIATWIIYKARTMDFSGARARETDESTYLDSVIQAGCIATVFWGSSASWSAWSSRSSWRSRC
jgi:cytochrome c oxidase cbb3-type subunit 1